MRRTALIFSLLLTLGGATCSPKNNLPGAPREDTSALSIIEQGLRELEGQLTHRMQCAGAYHGDC